MENSKKAFKVPIWATLATLVTGMLMRAFHWPYATVVIFISFVAILVFYALRFSRKSEKKPIDYMKMALVLFFATNGILKILDFPYILFFQIVTALTFVAYFVMDGTAYFMNNDINIKDNLTNIICNALMAIGVLTLILGGFMHLLGFDYSIPILTFGLTIITSLILKDIFSAPKTQGNEPDNEELYS